MTAERSFTLTSPEDSATFATRLGETLAPGDTVLFFGPVGAGKTHVCRHLVQSLQDMPEDVPSPTFTLVQVYDGASGTIWHADLYRLSGPDEIEELGLTDAFTDAICLIEWPERLGDLTPPDALTLELLPDKVNEDSRQLTLSWTDPKWDKKLEMLK